MRRLRHSPVIGAPAIHVMSWMISCRNRSCHCAKLATSRSRNRHSHASSHVRSLFRRPPDGCRPSHRSPCPGRSRDLCYGRPSGSHRRDRRSQAVPAGGLSHHVLVLPQGAASLGGLCIQAHASGEGGSKVSRSLRGSRGVSPPSRCDLPSRAPSQARERGRADRGRNPQEQVQDPAVARRALSATRHARRPSCRFAPAGPEERPPVLCHFACPGADNCHKCRKRFRPIGDSRNSSRLIGISGGIAGRRIGPISCPGAGEWHELETAGCQSDARGWSTLPRAIHDRPRRI